MRRFTLTILSVLLSLSLAQAQTNNDGLPATLPPFPEIPEKEPVGSVKMGDWQSFPEVQLDLPPFLG